MGGMMMPMMLAMMGVFMMTSMGGCSKDKKKTKEEMIHACVHDETGECQRKAAAWAAANPEAANAAANALMANDSDGNYLTNNPADSAAIAAQAAKVKAGIEADRNNPNSMYYDPPVETANNDGEKESNVADLPGGNELPVAILPASTEIVPASAFGGPSSTGYGVTTR